VAKTQFLSYNFG